MTKGTIQTANEEIEVLIPDKWEEVSLKMFLDVVKAEDPTGIVSALTGIKPEIISKCQHKDIDYIATQLNEIFTFDSLTEQVGDTELSQVELNKETYRAVKDFGNLPYGQFEDMKKFSKGMEKGELSNLPILLSIMLQLDEEYDGAKSIKRDFSVINIVQAMKLRNFFLQEWLKYFRTALTDSSSKRKKTQIQPNNIQQAWKTFKTHGARFLQSSGLLKKKQSSLPSTERKN